MQRFQVPIGILVTIVDVALSRHSTKELWKDAFIKPSRHHQGGIHLVFGSVLILAVRQPSKSGTE